MRGGTSMRGSFDELEQYINLWRLLAFTDDKVPVREHPIDPCRRHGKTRQSMDRQFRASSVRVISRGMQEPHSTVHIQYLRRFFQMRFASSAYCQRQSRELYRDCGWIAKIQFVTAKKTEQSAPAPRTDESEEVTDGSWQGCFSFERHDAVGAIFFAAVGLEIWPGHTGQRAKDAPPFACLRCYLSEWGMKWELLKSAIEERRSAIPKAERFWYCAASPAKLHERRAINKSLTLWSMWHEVSHLRCKSFSTPLRMWTLCSRTLGYCILK